MARFMRVMLALSFGVLLAAALTMALGGNRIGGSNRPADLEASIAQVPEPPPIVITYSGLTRSLGPTMNAGNGIHALDVRTRGGDIVTENAAKPGQILIEATVKLSTSDPSISKADQGRYLPEFAESNKVVGSTLVARIVPPADIPKSIGWSADYRITVPPTVDLDLRTTRGTIKVDDKGSVGHAQPHGSGESLSTTSGPNVEVKRINGAVTGSIHPASSTDILSIE